MTIPQRTIRTAAKSATTATSESTGGHHPTLFVAADNATDLDKSIADFQCTGTDDQEIINEAIESLPEHQTSETALEGGGRVVLSAGVFNLSGPIVLTPLVHLQGMGTSTILRRAVDDGGGGPDT